MGHVYLDRNEQLRVLIPFLRRGLLQGERCVYIVDQNSIGEMTEILVSELGVRPEHKKGRLGFWTEWGSRNPGEFEPDRMCEVIRRMRDDAVSSGYRGLRLAVEMTWAPATQVNAPQLYAWEAVANKLFDPGCRLTAVCQYDWLRFHPEVIVSALRTHEHIIIGEELCPNPYYGSPDAVVTAKSQRQVAEWMIDQLRRVRSAEIAREEAVQKQAARSAAIAELSWCALEGMDLATLMNKAVVQIACNLDVELAKILELKPDGRSLLLRAGVGWKHAVVGRTEVGAGADSQAGYTLGMSQPVIVQDFTQERRFRAPELLCAHGVVSGVSVMIPGCGRRFGVLGAHSTSPRQFTPDEVDFLQGVANVLAEAIERRSAEEAVRKAEQKYHDIFMCAQEGIFQLTEEGRFLTANPALAHMLGYNSPEELIHTVTDVGQQLHVEPERRTEFLQQLLRDGMVSGFEARMRKKDGETIWVIENARALFDANDHFLYYEGTLQDISDRRRAQDSLRRLSSQLLHAQDLERRRLARELHDSAGQSLAALALHLGSIQLASSLPEQLQQALSESLTLVEGCVQEVRTLSYLLHPPSLDEYGLISALCMYVRGFSERSGIQVELDIPENMPRLAEDIELVVFRIAQEGLTNVHRHSGSPTARVRIMLDPGCVSIEVTDWGHGMPIETRSSIDSALHIGVGLAGMEERVRNLGGCFSVHSDSSGTVVHAVIPLAASQGKDRESDG